jgi:hypothetical protein
MDMQRSRIYLEECAVVMLPLAGPFQPRLLISQRFCEQLLFELGQRTLAAFSNKRQELVGLSRGVILQVRPQTSQLAQRHAGHLIV